MSSGSMQTASGRSHNAVVWATYASVRGHTIVTTRLYPPAEWLSDQRRRQEMQAPAEVGSATSRAWVQMLAELRALGRLRRRGHRRRGVRQQPGPERRGPNPAVGHVLDVPRSLMVTSRCGTSPHTDDALTLAEAIGCNRLSAGAGSKVNVTTSGHVLPTAGGRRHLLVRRAPFPTRPRWPTTATAHRTGHRPRPRCWYGWPGCGGP